jgi:hypothetical protein
MGGRGAASGVSAQGYKYGTEFKTLMSVDNIKFVQFQNSTAATIPKETMSAGRNRVYVLVNKSGTLKSITFYDKSGLLKRQIDFGHGGHQGFSPHVHRGYEHSPNAYSLTKSDKAYVEKARRLWNRQS